MTGTVVALPCSNKKALATETASGKWKGLKRNTECSYRGYKPRVSTAIIGDKARQSVGRHFSSMHNVIEPQSLM